jgi:YggT family protein
LLFAVAYYAISALELFIFAWALMSWFQPDPRNPIVKFIHMVVDPIMKPFVMLIPPIGGISFAGMAALAVLEYLIKPIFLRAAGMVGP